MPPVMFSVVTKYHKGRHSLFLYNSEIFYAFTQDILRSQTLSTHVKLRELTRLATCDTGNSISHRPPSGIPSTQLRRQHPDYLLSFDQQNDLL